MSSMTQDDLYAEEVFSDPYTYYGRLRETDPVHWNAANQMWLLTRYEDVSWFVRHPKVFSSENWKKDTELPNPPISASNSETLRSVMEFRSHEFIQNDPPKHTRMRSALQSSFNTRSLEGLRPMVREAVSKLFDTVSTQGSMDVVADIAKPLPLFIISEMIGIPTEDRVAVKEHADLRMSSAISILPNRMQLSAEGIKSSSAYLSTLVDDRLREPEHDLLSLFAEEERSGRYSRAEVLANLQSLIDAGHETTIQLICNGTLAFLRNPRQWTHFKSDPDGLAVSATEECLRYDPPLPILRRVAQSDITRQGQSIHAGDRVIGVIAAANRDPRAFPHPDDFDITRSPNNHLAFGAGIHYCLGQYLARMEGQEVFRAFATRLPDIRLASGPIEYWENPRNRSVKALFTEWG